jgi:hypothetical protein
MSPHLEESWKNWRIRGHLAHQFQRAAEAKSRRSTASRVVAAMFTHPIGIFSDQDESLFRAWR